MTEKLLRASLIPGVTAAFLTGALAALAIERATAAAQPEYRVIATHSIPIGPRGADQYHSLLDRLGAEGWRYDHSLDGFVVFRRQ